MGDYYHAIPWLEEAVSLFRRSYGEWKTEDEASLEDALDYLAFACFQVCVCVGGNEAHFYLSQYNVLHHFLICFIFLGDQMQGCYFISTIDLM